VEAARQFYPDLCVLQFDAHADLRQTYGGEKYSHATVMRRIAEIIGPERVYQFGIRSGSRDEFQFGQENTNFFPYEITGPLEQVMPKLTGRALYVTIDIDVVDPGYAPGTGTPEPGGPSAAEMMAIIKRLSHLTVIGFDVVEVCPPADNSWVTAILAAKIVREALIGLGRRRKDP
jgi:agmatinase